MQIISQLEVEELITPQIAIAAMRQAFLNLHQDEVVAPEEFSMTHPSGGDIHIKGAHLFGSEWMVAKVASAGFSVPGNHGCVLGISSRTGEVAYMVDDGGFLTEMRTAAAVALSVDLLARPGASRLAIIGSGVQAGFKLDAVRAVRQFEHVSVYSRTRAKAHRFASRHGITLANPLEDALADADVVLVATTSRSPILTSLAELRPGTHVTASGADMVGKAELAPAIIEQADVVVVDDRALAERVGILQGVKERPTRTLGELLTGTPGRTNDDQTTVAGLSGLGIQDAAIFAALLDALNDY